MKSSLPSIFIGSSKEDLDVAYAIQENLDHDADVTVWDQDIFKLTENTLKNLINSINEYDYAIFVFNANDDIIIRKNNYTTARDNVIFEMGLFIGRLGSEKIFYVVPDGIKNFHLPTDLAGTTPGKYRVDRKDGNIKAALGPFCNQVRKAINPKNSEYKKDITPEEVFSGKWNNFHIITLGNGKRVSGSEEVFIKNNNEYYANGKLAFKVVDLTVDKRNGKITFSKQSLDGKTLLKNDLQIISDRLFTGKEESHVEIKYERID